MCFFGLFCSCKPQSKDICVLSNGLEVLAGDELTIHRPYPNSLYWKSFWVANVIGWEDDDFVAEVAEYKDGYGKIPSTYMVGELRKINLLEVNFADLIVVLERKKNCVTVKPAPKRTPLFSLSTVFEANHGLQKAERLEQEAAKIRKEYYLPLSND